MVLALSNVKVIENRLFKELFTALMQSKYTKSLKFVASLIKVRPNKELEFVKFVVTFNVYYTVEDAKE